MVSLESQVEQVAGFVDLALESLDGVVDAVWGGREGGREGGRVSYKVFRIGQG